MHDEEAEELPAIEQLTPAQLLREFDINVAAPMVRYSKLPFRQLVSEYNTHITHTPMLLAKEFARSHLAREADFSTNDSERGIFHLQDNGALVSESLAVPGSRLRRRIRGCLIAQFAANDPEYLSAATELIKPYVDAVGAYCSLSETPL
jgi:tRNA-dihydrouridine synthase 4